MKKGVKLYSVIFPLWFLILWPPLRLAWLPVCFLLNTLVLYIACRVMKLEPFAAIFKKTILKLWLCGFPADIAGGVLLFGITTLNLSRYLDFVRLVDLSGTISYPPLQQPLALLVIFLCLVVSAVLSYLLNRFFSFRALDVTEKQKRRLGLVFAIFTAPWPLLIPAALFT